MLTAEQCSCVKCGGKWSIKGYKCDDIRHVCANDPKSHQSSPAIAKPLVHIRETCVHMGAEERREQCGSCKGRVEVKIFACAIHGECSLARGSSVQNCATCSDYLPPSLQALGIDDDLLRPLFEQTPLVTAPKDSVIVTAADAKFWPYLRLLALSLYLSHDVPRLCFDLGFTSDQRNWLEGHGFQVIAPPPAIVPHSIDRWQAWNKPTYVAMAAEIASNVLWIDADAFVLGSLRPIFDLLQSSPVFTPNHLAKVKRPRNWRSFICNDQSLYRKLPVAHMISGTRHINNGVFALQFPRDREVLDFWIDITKIAASDRDIRKSIRCYDQGALLWVIEKLGLADCIVEGHEWNDCVTLHDAKDLTQMANILEGARPVICHQAGSKKPLLKAEQMRVNVVRGGRRRTAADRRQARNSSANTLNLSGEELWRLFEQTPKVKLPDDCAIATVATPNFWPHLQLLAISLQLSHDVRAYCIDLGMSVNQRDWLEDHGMTALQQEGDLPFPGNGNRGEVIWNKPAFIKQVSQYAPNVIWIDADAFVSRSLRPMYDLLQHEPVFTPDHIAKHRRPKDWEEVVDNRPDLYKIYPATGRPKKTKYINAGICAWQFPRDERLYDSWIWLVNKAAEVKIIRDLIRCWDQGALLWAIEKHQLTDLVIETTDWNNSIALDGARDLQEISQRLFKGADPSTIYHAAGHDKPLLRNPNQNLAEPVEAPLSLKVFVLGHKQSQFSNIAKKHFLEFVRLDQVGAGEWNHNCLAEYRFFCTDLIEQSTEDYLGMASASWNSKYKSRIDHVWKLDLEPNVIWVADTAPQDWVLHSEKEHPGISWAIERLAKIAGVIRFGKSAWANNWIASRDNLLDLKGFFLEVFGEFWRENFPKYGYDDLPFSAGKWDGKRKWAYVGERACMLWLESRRDLEIRQI